MMNHRPVCAEVSLKAIKDNLGEVRRLVGQRQIMAVVKANAYGHGSVPVAKALLEAGADALAVSMLGEGMVLREAGVTCPILILGWTPEADYETAIENDVTMAVYNLEEAKRLSQVAEKLGKIALIHLKVDTGMSRLGLMPDQQGITAAAEIVHLPGLAVRGIFSHFSKADERDKTYARQQLATFQQFVEAVEEQGRYHIPLKHLANSAGIMDLPESYFDMVRPGIILYGAYPSAEVERERMTLHPALTWKAHVSRVQLMPAGTLVGYGGTYCTTKETLVATVPVGYADGYDRRLGNQGFVVYGGKHLPVIGRICMDQFMIDASATPQLAVGDQVTLLGRDSDAEMTADDLAAIMGTISYEVFCDISIRVPRVYV